MTNCKWDGSERPRILPGRHEDDCAGDCSGCQPCPWVHCRRCYREHVEAETGTCPGCLADVRADIAEITRMCATLPAEVLAKGVESEAMNLLGPVADPEALGHMKASVNVGRIPADWLEVADDEKHPLLVLGTWMEAYIEAFEHVDPERITVASAASYLDRNLTYIGAEGDVPFEDFARDVAGCRSHMERVLHDGEQVETGAPCMTCEGVRLQLVRGEREDRWKCPRCRQESSEDQYRFAVKAAFIAESDELNADDMAARTGIASSTIRKWANVMRVQAEGGEPEELPALIEPVGRVNGRKVYAVADVEDVAEAGDTRRSDWKARQRTPVLEESA